MHEKRKYVYTIHLSFSFSIFNNKLLNYDFLGSGLIGVSFPNWCFGICEVNGKLVDMATFNWWLLFYYLDHVLIQRSKTHDTNLNFLVRVYFAFCFCHFTFFIFHVRQNTSIHYVFQLKKNLYWIINKNLKFLEICTR